MWVCIRIGSLTPRKKEHRPQPIGGGVLLNCTPAPIKESSATEDSQNSESRSYGVTLPRPTVDVSTSEPSASACDTAGLHRNGRRTDPSIFTNSVKMHHIIFL